MQSSNKRQHKKKNARMSVEMLHICTKTGHHSRDCKRKRTYFDAKDDIIQASVKELKRIQDNKLIMIKVAIQRGVTTIKITKKIMSKSNN